MSERPGLQAAVLFAFTFGVYATGACRTIYAGDSGELAAAAATLGIPHPSGYPLYVLLGKLWTLAVPLGSIAFRMSLFSALFAAAACGLLYRLARRQGLAAAPGLAAALLLAFSPSFWSQANVQRVYSLNAFFVVAVTLTVVEWHHRRRFGLLVLAAFLAGLGAANHTVMVPVGFAAGIFAAVTEPALLGSPRRILACAGAAAAGLLPYAYLPWRSRQEPRLDWGDPETLGRFLDVVLRRDFWDRAWIESPLDLPVIAGDYLLSLGEELLWAGTVLALAGAVAGFRRGWPVLLPLLVMAANLAAVALHGSRSDLFIWHRYYIPSYAMAALLAGYGCQAAAERWGKKAWAALAVPLALFVAGWPRFDRSDYALVEDFSRKLLASLPPGAHLAASDDNVLFALIYLHLVEGVRPDVDLILQGVGGADLPALRFDPDDDPLFFTHHPNWNVPELEVVPVGLVYRTVRSGRPPPEPVIPASELAGAWDPAVPKDYLSQNLAGHFHFMLGVTFETRDWARAETEFRRAVAAAPANDVLFYNLGLIYRRNGLLRRALRCFERAREINPRPIPSAGPVRAADRVAELAPEVERLAAMEAEAGVGASDHRRWAELLEARGEILAARGHRRLALEAEAGLAQDPTW